VRFYADCVDAGAPSEDKAAAAGEAAADEALVEDEPPVESPVVDKVVFTRRRYSLGEMQLYESFKAGYLLQHVNSVPGNSCFVVAVAALRLGLAPSLVVR
jgi:hypothetical protein